MAKTPSLQPLQLYINAPITRQDRDQRHPTGNWTPIKVDSRGGLQPHYYNQFNWNAPTPARLHFQTNAYGSRVYVGPNAAVSNTN